MSVVLASVDYRYWGYFNIFEVNRPFSLPKSYQLQHKSCLLEMGYICMSVNGMNSVQFSVGFF